MKTKAMRAAVAALVLAAQPAAAAELIDAPGTMAPQRGAFAGGRLSLPLGRAGEEKALIGLAVAGAERSRSTGETRLAQGVEFGIAQTGKLQLTVGGRRVEPSEEQRKAGVSTLGWVAIGVGVVVVGVGAYGLWLSHELSKPSD